MWKLLLLLTPGILLAGSPLFEQSAFHAGQGATPAGWHAWAPRPDNASRNYVDEAISIDGPGALVSSGNSNQAVLGGWEHEVAGVVPGEWYRLAVHYRTVGVDSDNRQVVVRLDWRRTDGGRAGQPEYAYRTQPAGEWTRITAAAPAPGNAASVRIQLLLWDAPRGTVWWDGIRLERTPPPAPRKVRVASINFHPGKTASAEESVGRFIEVIEKTVPDGVDLILLPEGITTVGNPGTYADVAEPVPGPVTRRLGEVARRHRAYLAAGIYEREGPAIYNTAVLLDRSGRLIGKYRKVYIPREETEGGITPGDDYPVFDADFGKLGMMICWDVQYADPARALALRGAEVLLMPIWGGNTTLGAARAIENHVFLVSSGYDYPTEILDPDGEKLAVAPEEGSAAIATIDLSKRYADEWLGNMRARFFDELRLDIDAVPPPRP